MIWVSKCISLKKLTKHILIRLCTNKEHSISRPYMWTMESVFCEYWYFREKTLFDKEGSPVCFSMLAPSYLSPCCSARMRVRAWAASSNAQLTDDVKRRRTSGSANALPSAVDNLPIPAKGDTIWINLGWQGHKESLICKRKCLSKYEK